MLHAGATLAAWLHDLSPFAIRFSEHWGLRWYGLSYALGFVIGWLVVRWLAKIGFSPIPADRAGDVILLCVIGVIVGGRLGYVLFYQPSLLWMVQPRFPWWGVLALNQGGMASHGGVAGVIIAAFFIGRGFKNRQGVREGRAPVLHVLDVLALAVPFGLGLGRIANFVNGELLGRVVARPGQAAPWWAVRYPQEISDEYGLRLKMPSGYAPVHTEDQWTQITRLVDQFRLPGQTFDMAYQRMLDQLHRGDATLAQHLSGLVSARHPSQIYQAVAEGLIVGLVVWWVARRPRLPGVVGAWFMISYGVLRIATEFVRLPDSHLAVQRIAGLSRGQWLSVAMVLVGVVGLAVVYRRGGAKMGGWLENLRRRGGRTI
jgi:phosphatidylglycerol---prolipoprotein diacylglyceryl transferase